MRSERQLLANPPFNDSDWFGKDDDVRWQFGVPPKGNANFAWVQHFNRKTPEQIDAAIRQLVSKAITTEGQVIDVFTAAGY